MRKLLALGAAAAILMTTSLSSQAQDGEALAIMIPGGGNYHFSTSLQSEEAQAFFDQGVRMSWSFYFPEAIASFQEASRLEPDNPMPFYGLAHAIGPNPNSRYAGLPDDPQ